MATLTKKVNDKALYGVAEDGKAELVDGRLVLMAPTGALPGYAADEIFASLREHARRTGYGRAVSDNKGFLVNLPHRRSFSPDAAYYAGPDPGMKFYHGPPIFAVEVRSENDYGASSEQAMAEKRADYFAAGCQVVWDVDLLTEDVIRCYRSTAPHHPTIFRRQDVADAEPAVAGWTFQVADLFA